MDAPLCWTSWLLGSWMLGHFTMPNGGTKICASVRLWRQGGHRGRLDNVRWCECVTGCRRGLAGSNEAMTVAKSRGGGAENGASGESEAKPRSLALDVFGDYVRYDGEELPLRSLVSLLECFGVAGTTTRMMMSRLRSSGIFASRSEGRQTIYRLTPKGLAILDEGRQRIFERGRTRWDGVWSLVIYSVPESDRAARERLRRSLQWFGFGQLASGSWVCPHDRLDEVTSAFGSDQSIQLNQFHATSMGVEHDREFAARCWDLKALHGAYAELANRIDQRMTDYSGDDLTDREAFIERMRIVHEYRLFPYRDPDLPLELLPHDWAGTYAHESFSTAHRLLRGPADRYFRATVR